MLNIFFACHFFLNLWHFFWDHFCFFHVGLLYSYVWKCLYFTSLSMCWGFVVVLQLGFQFFHHLLLKRQSFFYWITFVSCQKQLPIFVWVCFSVFYVVPLISVCSFLSTTLSWLLLLTILSWNCVIWTRWLVLFQHCFGFSNSFSFHIIFRSACWYIQNLLGFWLGLPWMYI